MTLRCNLSASLVACATIGLASVEAAPAPKEAPGTPITVENANKLRVSFEVEKGAYRIKHIAKTNELIIYEHKNAAEFVEDETLKPVHESTKDKAVTDVTVSPDGELVAWHDRGSKSYTIQKTKNGKTFEIEIGEHPGLAAFSPDSQTLAIGFSYWDPQAEGVGYSEMKLFDTKGKLRTLKKPALEHCGQSSVPMARCLRSAIATTRRRSSTSRPASSCTS